MRGRWAAVTLSVVGALGGGVATAHAQRPAPADPQIVGGTPPNRAWPAQGLLQIEQQTAQGTVVRLCGGTLVSGRWFLTAGHCVSDSNTKTALLPASAFTVNLGESDTTQFGGPERFAVDQPPVRHEQFTVRNQRTADNDIALLHLAAPTPAGARFEPMRLIATTEAGLWSPGVIATVIGWGNTDGGATTTQLRQAGVPINSDTSCEAAYANTLAPFVAATMLCAGDGTSDTCYGDSGGPLLVPRVDEFALAGVTSYGGAVCGDPAFPGVYVRAGVAALNDWIRGRIPTATMAIAPQPPDPGDDVALQATVTKPATQLGSPTFRWDLDDDRQFDDANGANATLPNVAPGSHPVRVETSYPDGDRALAREVITTVGSPLPQPPPPPPPPPKPAPAAPPADRVEATPTPPPVTASSVTTRPAVTPSALPALARLMAGSRRVHVRSLLDRRTSIGVECTAACDLRARLTLDGRTAKALHLGTSGHAVLLGTGRRHLTAARSIRLAIRLTRKAARALRRATGGALRIRVTATAGARSQRLERALRLLR
ncbi:MAG TPA: serine protease [Solirubrobacteraceae bacterium]|nr:serine protease [Solirubrobacteraceae bacterium]